MKMSIRGTKKKDASQNFTGNRTGIQIAPELSQELIEGAENSVPSSKGSAREISVNRGSYINEGVPVGSMPALTTQSSEDDETGTLLFLDKLGERLAFERMGTRLYEALINKCEVLGEEKGGPSLEDLQEIHEEELDHFLLLQRVITELGGDPTVQTPSANIAGVMSLGQVQVLTDPRTSTYECLQAILTAELVDNDCWQTLIDLATNLGYDDIASEFEQALEHEDEHLERVRNWISTMTMKKAALA
jgi:ferritin-like metal-binding protein YciE